jgi:hypothetical protein
MSDHEQRQRELAYRLWEEAGYPHGRSDEFWYTALEILVAESRPPVSEATPSAEPAAAEAAAPVPPVTAEPAQPPPAAESSDPKADKPPAARKAARS